MTVRQKASLAVYYSNFSMQVFLKWTEFTNVSS